MSSRVVFFAPPMVTPLDLIGPLQAFKTASKVVAGAYRIEVCGLSRSVLVAGNLHFANLRPYSPIELGPDDILMVAGFSDEPELSLRCLRTHPRLFEWIRRSWRGRCHHLLHLHRRLLVGRGRHSRWARLCDALAGY